MRRSSAMSSIESAAAQSNLSQSYTTVSPTPLGPLDELTDDGTAIITIGAARTKPEDCTVVELKYWLKSRRTRVGENTLAVSGTKQTLIDRVTNAVRTGVVPVSTSAPRALGQLPVPVKIMTPPEQWCDDQLLLMQKAPVVSEDMLFSHLQTGTGNTSEANAFRALTDILWALNKLGPTRGPSTSLPCQWNMPIGTKEPKQVADLRITRHDPTKPIKRESLPLDNYDPRPLSVRSNTRVRFSKLCERMAEIEQETGAHSFHDQYLNITS